MNIIPNNCHTSSSTCMLTIYLFLIHYVRSQTILVGDEDPYVTDFCKVKCKFKKNVCCLYSVERFGPDCGENASVIPITEEDIRLILDTHNSLRDEVAGGMSRRADLRGLTAANMHVLSYSKELAYSASCWAKQCKLSHSRCRAIKDGLAGETICWDDSPKSSNATVEVARRLLTRCPYIHFNNLPKFNYKIINNLGHIRKGDDERNRETVQVIWAMTRYIGCSRVVFPHADPLRDIVLLVCHYFPSGNILNNPVFVLGAPSSQCTHNETSNDAYNNLCGEVRAMNEDVWLSGSLRIYIYDLQLLLILSILLYSM